MTDKWEISHFRGNLLGENDVILELTFCFCGGEFSSITSNLMLKCAIFNFTMADKSILLVHNPPPGTEFGIDYSSWYIGPRFCGLNAIPNGFHFVFTSSVDKNLQHSPRNGQFLFFDGKDEETDVFFEASWNETNEELGIFKKYQDTIPGLVCI